MRAHHNPTRIPAWPGLTPPSRSVNEVHPTDMQPSRRSGFAYRLLATAPNMPGWRGADFSDLAHKCAQDSCPLCDLGTKIAEWAAVMDIFVLESVFEGLPLVLLALMFSMQCNGRPCQLVSCDLEPYHTVLPLWALSVAPTPPSMTLDYSAALQADGCAYQPLTSDVWFSMRVSSRLAQEGFSYSAQDVWHMGPSGWLGPFNFTGTSPVPGCRSPVDRTLGQSRVCSLNSRWTWDSRQTVLLEPSQRRVC
jgi:hypothetical protein